MHLVKPCVVWCIYIKCFDNKTSGHGKWTFSQEGWEYKLNLCDSYRWTDSYCIRKYRQTFRASQLLLETINICTWPSSCFQTTEEPFCWLSSIYMCEKDYSNKTPPPKRRGWWVASFGSFFLSAVYFCCWLFVSWLPVSTASCSLLSAYWISLCDAEARLFFIAVLSCVIMSPSFLPLDAGRSSGGCLRKVLRDKKNSFSTTVSPQLAGPHEGWDEFISDSRGGLIWAGHLKHKPTDIHRLKTCANCVHSWCVWSNWKMKRKSCFELK